MNVDQFGSTATHLLISQDYDFNTVCSILISPNVCSISFPLHPSSKVIGGSFVSLLFLLKFVITDLQYDRAKHFINQAPFHSTFPILVITKIVGTYVCPSVTKSVTIREFYFTCLAVHRTITFSAMAAL